MSADVEIVLDAEDRASAKLRAAAAQLEATGKKIKDTGEATKKSTELFGQLAGVLGGGELSSAASQFAGLTEKVGGFSDVLKAGNTGAMVFKAGLVGLVGVIAFQLGKAIGDVIFQTKEWKEALEEANEKAKELNQTLIQQLGTSFADQKLEIEIISNADEQRKEYEKLLDQLQKNLAGAEDQIRATQQELESLDDPANFAAWTSLPVDREQLEKAIEADRERLKVLTEQRNEIMKLLNAETELESKRVEIAAEEAAAKQQQLANEQSAKYIEQLRTEITLLSAKKGQLNEILAEQGTSNEADAAMAQQLLDQRDAIKAEQQRKIEADKTVETLQQQLDILRLGKDEYERRQQLAMATTDEERKQIAALQEQIARREELAEVEKEIEDREKKEANQTLQSGITATQGRLITRGNAQDSTKQLVKVQERSLAELQQIKGYLEEQARNVSIELVQVGA